MARFLWGLGLGAAGSAVTYGLYPYGLVWLIVGLVIAVLIWFGECLLDEVL